MASFSYKAKDSSGNTVTGAVEAPDASGAAGKIREMGHLPMDIREMRTRAPAGTSTQAGSVLEQRLISPLWTGVNIRQLAYFFTQLAALLPSGMTISEALRSIGSRTRGRLGRIVREASSNVQSGGKLSDTLSRHPRVFSPLQIALIRAGESGGLIQPMIERIASYLEYELKIRRMIAKMLIYPIAILAFAVCIYVAKPHLATAATEGMGVFIKAIAPGLIKWIVGALLVVVVLKLVFQFDTARLAWDSVKTVPPIVGGVAMKIAMSRFSRALAVLYGAGMPIAEAVSVGADASANLAIGRGIKLAVPAIQSGEGLTESLTKTHMLLPIVLDMMMAGEKSGNVDAALQKAADYMEDEVDATIHKLGIALLILMLLIAGVVVGLIVVDFWTKYYGGLLS